MVYDETFNADFYKSLTLFKLNLNIKLAQGQSGSRKSNAKGNSVEFSDFREYIPGDDIRRIDWNAYARFDRLFIKLFMEEKEGLFRIYLDTSASMNFGAKSKKKLAKQIAAALSYCILDHSDRVTIGALGNNVCHTYKSVTGRQGFSKVTDTLASLEFTGENDLYRSICSEDIKLSGMTVVISDFFTNDTEDIIKYLIHKKQDVFFVQVLSEEELTPTLDGTLNLIDSENRNNLKVTGSSYLQHEYKKSLDRFLESTESLCKKYGVRYSLISTKDSFEKILRG